MRRGAVEPPPAVDGARAARGGFAGILASAAFLRLWLAQALATTAQQTINFALLVQVRQSIEARGVGGGNTATSLLILAFTAPPILFSSPAGVLVDRSGNKRALMAGVHVARALCTAGYLLLRPDWPVLATLVAIYALCFTFSSVGQLYGPAEGATIPRLVARDQLIGANALFSMTYFGAQLAGFVFLGPLLTSLVELRTIYFGVVLLYGCCALLVLSLPAGLGARADTRARPRRALWDDLREVWRYIGRDRLLRKAIGYLTIANAAFFTIAALAPEFIIAVLGLPAGRLATVLTPAGLGTIAGTLLVGRVGRGADRETLADRALLAVSLLLLGLVAAPLALRQFAAPGPFPPAVVAAMVLAAGLGLANAFIIVPSQTLLQERSHEAIRARVLATFFTTSNAIALLPVLFAGLLGDLLGVVRVLLLIATLLFALGAGAEWRRSRGQGPKSVNRR